MWQKILSGENDRHYILKLDNISVGIMTVAKPQDDKLSDTFYEVHGIYLHPDYYGKGFGTLAMNFAINLATSLGKIAMVVCVLEDNFNARKFYEKCGFTYDGTKNEVTYGKPLNVIRFRRDI
jgi:GNAT superfamily N-acetyltransferase